MALNNFEYCRTDLGILYCGDCLEVMKAMPDNSIDSIVTDPPYALEFMGKGWDKVLPSVDIWKEALRVAKPGTMLLAFGGTRTYHRLTCSIEDAGWEIRDCIMWVYGSGFPKSLNIGKAVDKLQGNEREKVGIIHHAKKDFKDNLYAQAPANVKNNKIFGYGEEILTKGQTEWEGYGTALKPAYDPIVLAMKPLDGTFAENALKWGVAGINIDECRVGLEENSRLKKGGSYSGNRTGSNTKSVFNSGNKIIEYTEPPGRFPANLIHDGSDEVMRSFPDSKGQQGDLLGHSKKRLSPNGCFGEMAPALDHIARNDSGSASRFFYCAKTSKSERNAGCEGLKKVVGKRTLSGGADTRGRPTPINHNNHPTVKPIKLLEYLCKLSKTPTNGITLDPFGGTATTGIACTNLNIKFIIIEKEPDYCEISKHRLNINTPITINNNPKPIPINKQIIQKSLF